MNGIYLNCSKMQYDKYMSDRGLCHWLFSKEGLPLSALLEGWSPCHCELTSFSSIIFLESRTQWILVLFFVLLVILVLMESLQLPRIRMLFLIVYLSHLKKVESKKNSFLTKFMWNVKHFVLFNERNIKLLFLVSCIKSKYLLLAKFYFQQNCWYIEVLITNFLNYDLDKVVVSPFPRTFWSFFKGFFS